MCKHLPYGTWFDCMNKIKGVMERSWDLTSCSSIIVAEERCGQLQRRARHIGDDRTIGRPAGPAADVGLSDKIVLRTVEPERRSYVSPLEPRRSWVPNVGRLFNYSNWVLFWFVCDCTLVLLSWSICNLCFDFYRNPLNEILDNLKRLWSLKVLEFFKAYRTWTYFYCCLSGCMSVCMCAWVQVPEEAS